MREYSMHRDFSRKLYLKFAASSAEEHCTNTTAARAEFVQRKLHISCCASEVYKENYIVVLCQAFFWLCLRQGL